jgi:hypothetical protein
MGCASVVIEPADGGGGQGGQGAEGPPHAIIFDSEREGLPTGFVMSSIPPQCGGALTTIEDSCPGYHFEVWFPPELLKPGVFPVDSPEVFSRVSMAPNHDPTSSPWCPASGVWVGRLTIDEVTDTEVRLTLSGFNGDHMPDFDGSYVVPRCREPLQ